MSHVIAFCRQLRKSIAGAPLTTRATAFWGDLATALSERYRVVRRSDRWLGILWGDGDDTLLARVERVELESRPCLLILTDVCPAENLDIWELMKRNLSLAISCYAIEGERVVLRAAAPLDANSVAIVPTIIDGMGREALDRQRAAQLGAPDTAELAQLFPE